MTIGISNLQILCIIGCTEEEQREARQLLVDCTFTIAAPVRDHIDATVDYTEIAALIERFIAGKKFQLLETLTQQIASAIFEKYTQIQELTLCICKPEPFASCRAACTEYTMRR